MKIFIKVKPAARKDEVEKVDDNNFKVSVKEPPVEGKANRAVVRALADYFGVPQACVRVLAGHASKSKIIEIIK
jgi:hypothetical protein